MSDTTTTSDTSAIDEKKNNDSTSTSSNIASNVGKFIIKLILLIICILLYFSGSGLILFICKLAQSNILPTETECAPYTDKTFSDIEKIDTNIFTTFTEPKMSMKLNFPYDDYNSSNKLIDMFKKYKNKSSSNFLANYFISIIEDLVSFNFSSINTIMNSLNSAPEELIVALGPIITGFMFAIMTFINALYTIYLWFANMKWFFKTNTNDTGDGLPKWEDITITSPIDWVLGICLVILFTILFFPGFGLILLVPFIVLSYCCLSCMMYKGVMNDKKTTSLNIIKELLKYYKLTIVSLICVGVIILAFSYLGIVPGIFSILVLALIYWGILSSDLFTPIKETNLTPLVSDKQAFKKCNPIKEKKEKHGFLYNLLFGQSGGKKLTQDLKKLNKKLSK